MSEFLVKMGGRVAVRETLPARFWIRDGREALQRALDEARATCERHLRVYGYTAIDFQIWQPDVWEPNHVMTATGRPLDREGWDADGAPVGTVTP